MHRGYHVLAVPTWERKVRVALVWFSALLFGRDIVPLLSVQHPRAEFVAVGLGARQRREAGEPMAAGAAAQPAGSSGTDEAAPATSQDPQRVLGQP